MPSPNILILNFQQLSSYQPGELSHLICIQDTKRSRPKNVGKFSSALFHEYLDHTPEQSGKICYMSHVKQYLDLAEKARQDSVIVVASHINCNRAAAIAAGMHCFYYGKPDYAMSEVVRQQPTADPNYWVLALFDYALELGGRLTTAADDYLATGIVVSPFGVTYKRG